MRCRSSFCPILVTGGIFCCLFSSVSAYDVETRGILTFEGLVNTDEDAAVVDGRLDFEIDAGPLTFGGTYRAYEFGKGNYNPAGIEPFHGLKHRYIEIKAGSLMARAGHFFATFGKGLSLRSFEDIDLEYDTWLDGVLAEYQTPSLKATLLAGKQIEQQTRFQYTEHEIRGARFEQLLGTLVTFAVSALERTSHRHDEQVALPESLSSFQDHVYGFETSLRLGGLKFAGDYARRLGDLYATGRHNSDGYGIYGSVTFETNRISLLGEYKNYKGFTHHLSSSPICVKEHLWILMNRVTHQVDYDDERGFLVEGMIPVGEWYVSGGASEARRQDGSLRHWEMFGYVESLSMPVGFRSIAGAWSREYYSGRFTEYVGGAVEFEITIAEKVTELDIEVQKVKEPVIDSFFNLLFGLTCYCGDNLTLSAVAEKTTDTAESREVWLMTEARLVLPADLDVAVAVGRGRGGKKCSGGICYYSPEFAGIRLRVAKFF